MDAVRTNLLEESCDRIINVGFCMVAYEDLSDSIDTNLVILDTTKDGKIFSIEEVDALLKSQFEQMNGRIEPELDHELVDDPSHQW